MDANRRNLMRTALIDHPDWTNPNVGMSALIAGAVNTWGAEGERVMRESYYHLGLKTGEYMLETNLVGKDCDATEWGRFTMDLMDLCGFKDYEEVEATPERHVFKVLRYPYMDAFTWFDAPDAICDIPGDWDRGCLAAVNPRIKKTSPMCMWNGDPYCLRVHEVMDVPLEWPYSYE